jgi:Ca2+/Na+ antiporter
MDLLDSALTRYALIAVSALFGAALLYFVVIGARALFREARSIAREAGHAPGSATVRALLRMAVWGVFFGLFYLLAFYLGKRLGWWAVPLVLAALAAMIWCLLLADRLLTVVPGDVRQQAGIAVTLLGALGLFTAGILLAIRS